MQKSHRLTGFTLLEVLLAMSLLSIMMVLLFSSLSISAESWNKGEKKIAQVNEKAVVYQFFKRHLPSIRPLWDDFTDNDRQFSFQGTNHSLQFVSAFPASSNRKGLQQFEVFFSQSNKGMIKVKLKPFYPVSEDQAWQEEEVVLLEKVEKFELTYFGKEDPGSDGFWVSRWQQKEQLPALIKIHILMADASYWPEMIFDLKLAADPEFRLEGK